MSSARPYGDDDPAPRAALVAVGDELVRGERKDANLAWLAARLEGLGFEVREARLVGDDEEQLAGVLDELLGRAELVVTTGGLGPTLDDVTRHSAARALGRDLRIDPEALLEVHSLWRSRGQAMPTSNERQALLPVGSTRLPNAHGTAPGFRAQRSGAWLAVLPGPPSEMRGVFQDALEPWLAAWPRGGARVRGTFLLFGLSESLFADRAGAWMERAANPRMGVLASAGSLLVKLEARGRDEGEARALLLARAREVRARFEPHVCGEDCDSLVELCGRALLAAGLPIALAESCTGGLVAARLTEVPGISAVFREGFVTYSNEAKVARLGVPQQMLETHGAVSAETARAMARGAALASGARLALSITGIAGPGGGSAEKPVGLVWFGLWLDGEELALERRFPARGRDWVREFATQAALDLLRRAASRGSLAGMA